LSVSTLLVDARPLDHPTARQRGIGRYVTGLLTGLRDIGAPAIALYGSDAEAEVLAQTVPGIAAQRWGPQVVREHAVDGTWYLATQLMLHPIPLDPVPRCVTEARLPVAAVMYDVIPYRYPETYFVDPNARRQAALRAPLARTLDALLAISDFAATTAAEELRFPLDRIVTIGAGVEARFRPRPDPPAEIRSDRVAGRHRGSEFRGDVARYVVTVAGGDDRKNTEGLLRAWAHLDRAVGDDVRLVVVGAHTPALLRRWQACAAEAGIAERVVFTGGLDDDDLVAVLQGAELSVMPSLEEGFGLPVLEAAACGVPAIASNVSSLPEVLDEPDACFDPHDPPAIAAAIERALTDEAHRSVLLAAGARATERWTWTNVATATVDALDALGPRWPQRIRAPRRVIAFAGRVSGIAGVDGDGDGSDGDLANSNAEIVDALRAACTSHDHVSVLVEHGGTSQPSIGPDRWPVRAVGRFVKPWDFDHIVAVLGAAPEHVATSTMARTVPCHLWIHDEAMIGVRFGANLRALEIARSAIVGSSGAGDLVRRSTDRACPILIVDPTLTPGDAAAAVASWLTEIDELDPSTIRHAGPAVASLDS
jgi:glycosyltransferase involved in cell wall biosynthesis